jgi:hypothetical protein
MNKWRGAGRVLGSLVVNVVDFGFELVGIFWLGVLIDNNETKISEGADKRRRVRVGGLLRCPRLA